MAEADFVDIESVCERKKYFCHHCTSEIVPEIPNLTCSRCHSGFVEEMDENALATLRSEPQHPRQLSSDESYMDDHHHDTGSLGIDLPEHLTRLRRVGVDHGSEHRTLRREPGAVPLHSFIDSILATLRTDPRDTTARSNSVGGDSVRWSFGSGRRRGGASQVYQRLASDIGNLDDIISRLVSQLSNGGPVAASPTQIANLPITAVDSQHVANKTHCSVCMEFYELGDSVTTLQCDHFYHNTCIVQWLQLHATCPVCRHALPPCSNASTTDGGDSVSDNSTTTSQPLLLQPNSIDDGEDDEDEDEDISDNDDDDVVVVNVYSDGDVNVVVNSGRSDAEMDDYSDANDVEMQPNFPPSSSLQLICVDEADVENDF